MTRRGPRSIGATRLMTKPPWLAILAVIYCTGCPQMLIMKGATTAASVIADDRTLSEQATDLELKEGIEQKFVSAAPTLASQVNVDVYLEHVMLTGVVGDWSDRRMADGLASQSLQHRVVNGTAFIIGEADDPSLIETAREVARQTPGVQRVVTHIMVER
jgi:osmotically-inducible protein OsmY